MLYGKFTTTVDDKGRSGMGQQFREHFKETAKAYWTSSCFRIYTDGAFEKDFAAELETAGADGSAGLGESEVSRARRRIFGNVYDVNFDKQGRLTIPKSVRKAMHLDIDDPVVWVGVDDFAELWVADQLKADDDFKDKLAERKRRFLESSAALAEAKLEAQWIPASPDTNDAGCAWPGQVPKKPAPDPLSTAKPEPGGDDRE